MLATFADHKLDGHEALKAVVAASPYGTLEQAVASLAVFSHPETVKQTGCRPFVRSVRDAARRGQYEQRDGVTVALDDNKSPTDAFLWCNGLRRPREAQFNHVYANSADPECYTCLANLCVTPAFLAKLTDTDPRVRALLRYRAFDLYRWRPATYSVPESPSGYDGLRWASTLPPVADVEATSRAVMTRRPKDRTVRIARRLGWLFGDAELDTTLVDDQATQDG